MLHHNIVNIPLNRRDKTIAGYAIIDAEDAALVNRYKWYMTTAGYAAARDENRNIILMHRLILNPRNDMEVDHINKNKLDNRKTNLREVSHHINSLNRGKHHDGSSPFKGVSKRSDTGSWQAYISFDGRRRTKNFNNPVSAAIWYNQQACLISEYIELNEIDELDYLAIIFIKFGTLEYRIIF